MPVCNLIIALTPVLSATPLLSKFYEAFRVAAWLLHPLRSALSATSVLSATLSAKGEYPCSIGFVSFGSGVADKITPQADKL